MSMYSSAWVDKGLLLTKNQFEEFKKNYLNSHKDIDPDDFDDLIAWSEELDASDPTSEIKSFHVTPLLADNCEGISLYPWEGTGNDPDYGKNAYAIVLDKDELNPFKPFPYKGIDAVVDEIKHKVGGYLPKDIDYKEQIGTISCSYYA